MRRIAIGAYAPNTYGTRSIDPVLSGKTYQSFVYLLLPRPTSQLTAASGGLDPARAWKWPDPIFTSNTRCWFL